MQDSRPDMADDETKTPSLLRQTMALGQILKATADNDPLATPTESAATAFLGWVAEAGPGSREPVYFADVAANYDVHDNTNRDLWELFGLLQNYIAVEDEDEDDEPPAPRRTFIGLPLAP